MSIIILHELVSKNASKGNLTINNSLLKPIKGSSFFDQYQIQSIDCTGATVGVIVGNQFTVSTTGVSIKFGWDKAFDVGGATITFFIDDEGNAQISFTYNLQGANLSQILTRYFDLTIDDFIPVFIAELPVDNPALTISTSPATFQFTYTVSPSLFPQVTISGLSVTLAIGVNGSKYTLTAGGSFSIDDQQFSGSITDSSLTATWSGSESFDLLQDFIPAMGFSPTYTLGDFDNIDLILTLASASFTYDTSGQLSFTATTSGGLDIYLAATGQSEYCAAVYLGPGADLSALSSDLSLFTGININNLLVVISGYDDDSFTIPNTPYTGVEQGIAIRAAMTMASADTNGILDGALEYLGGLFGTNTINVSIGYDDGNFSLTGEVDGPFCFPTAQNDNCQINNIGLTISSEAPQIALNCGLSVYYDFNTAKPDVTKLTLQGVIAFGCEDEEATVSFSVLETTTLIDPFGINGLTVSNVGFALDGSIGGEESITVEVQGDFSIGTGSDIITEDIAAAVSLTDGIINIPYLSSSTVGSFTLAEVWTDLITNVTQKSAPKFLNYITINQLNFYFCDQPNITLPGGQTAAIGTNFMANVSFGSIETYASLWLSTTAIQGDLETSPIYLPNQSNAIVSVTGNGQGNSTYNIAPGGPVINFNTDSESFAASVDANILGLQENITASLSNGILSVTFDQSFDNFADTSFTAYFSSLTDMSLNCTINIDSFNCTVGVSCLGNVNISGSVTGVLSVAFVAGVFSAGISCQVTWCGHTVHIEADITENFSALTDIVSAVTSAIEQQAESLFSPLITTAEEYIDAIVSNAIQNGEYVLNMLVNTFDVAEDDLYTLFNAIVTICETGHVDYNVNFSIDFNIPVTGPTVPLDFGKVSVGVGPVHFDEVVSTSVTFPGFSIPILNVDISGHLDYATTAINVDFSDPLISPSIPVLELVIVSGTVSVNATAFAKATVPLGDFFTSTGVINDDVDLGLGLEVAANLAISAPFFGNLWNGGTQFTISLDL